MTTATARPKVYPRIAQQETLITQLENELEGIKRKEQTQANSKQFLIRQHPNEKTDQELSQLKVEIEATQDQKLLTQDRLTAAKEDLPIIEQEATAAESDLTGKKEEIKTIRTKIEKIDGEITKALQKPISLIQSRQEAVHKLGKTSDEIQKLTSTLRWHPVAQEVLPAEPAAVTEFQELFPARVVRWRGR